MTATSDHAPGSGVGLSIGVSIRRYRVAEGLTLAELARRSGVSISTISKIENGKISGGFETIYKLARGLGVLVTEIIDGEAEAREHMVVHRGDQSDVHPTGLYDYYPQAFRHAGAYYRPEFLQEQLAIYFETNNLEYAAQIDPDEFARWIFPRLFHSRLPRYDAIAKHGYTVTSDEAAQVNDEYEFLQLLELAIARQN